MSDQKMFVIEVVQFDTGEVVKTLGSMSERRASKVDDGMNINLNHDEYFTRIREVPDDQA